MKILLIVTCLLPLLVVAGCHGQPRESRQPVVPVMELTIADAHSAFASGQYSSEDLVAAHLARIKRANPAVNALTTINPDALQQARELDREFQQTGQLRPLHGIPMIVKDNFNTRELPTTAGARALADFVPRENAFLVQKLLDAGAIILAKSNMAEWAFSPMHTESSTQGTTRNPYNLNRVPAGSSGGTAAAIAASMGVIGLGTDTGNSIRGPSSHNALVGFRPTLGLTSRSGIVPLYLRNDVAGPMMRTVEDAARVLEVMAGIDPEDPLTRYSKGRVPGGGYQSFLQSDGLRGARIGVLTELSRDDIHPEIEALFKRAIEDLRLQGATVVEDVGVANFEALSSYQWCSTFRQDVEEYIERYVKDGPVSTLEDIIAVGTASEYVRQRLEYFAENSGRYGAPEPECADAYSDARRIAFRQAIEDRMDELSLDAVIYPSWNNPPATLARFADDYLGDNSQVIAPHTGQPAFTVPMGYTEGNLPAGLQFLCRMYGEPVLIRLAYAYEQATRHRVSPPDQSGGDKPEGDMP
ncbi:MAG: amidase [Porticoccaceae bacterium]|nr:amidase [Porticoccaceae bacterium]